MVTTTHLVPPGGYEFHQDRFVLRFGVGAEFIVHKRFSIRLDASDLASRVPMPCNDPSRCVSAHWWNRLDAGVSAMFRLGALH